ncbi:Solute carrier organic anion transporter family member 4C1 [Geodia barretti]|uniref:Solute carrier organic anion transporter family member 4C1 n=1 Tax=Geodia barretti TaxID=519541 RepID=A0AA35RSG1_GEOBA|nr:Solute carrier organic anion transporter family member 4C1 [Geodia barretti]
MKWSITAEPGLGTPHGCSDFVTPESLRFSLSFLYCGGSPRLRTDRSVLSTIERRYRLTSTQTGALASMTDIAVVTSVIFISYFGGRGHKPRWLGVALIVEAIGAFVFSLPQFLFCQYAAYFFFMMGNILIGVGAAPAFSQSGPSYIDEIVHPNGEVRELREREMALRGRTVVRRRRAEDRWNVVREFPRELKRIAMNPSWLFVTLGLGLASVTISGFASFGVKYVENQFGLTTSEASIITGARNKQSSEGAIPTAGAGVITSGLLIYFFKIRGRKLPLMGLVTCSLAVLTVFGFLIHCPTPELAGVIVPYPDGSDGASDTTSLAASCTASCNCTSLVFDPVCGADNIVYFTPSEAALHDLTSPPPLLITNSSTSEGLCNEDCTWQLQLYLVISAFTLFFVFMLQIPNITITIRCVAEDQRTLALGLQSSIIRLIGFVPGPILFGVVFDSACLFWQRDCGRRGNCWVYDNATLSVRAVVLAILAMMCYIVFIILCWLFYPKSQPSSLTTTNEGARGTRERMGEFIATRCIASVRILWRKD